jgi:hypothetical protein
MKGFFVLALMAAVVVTLVTVSGPFVQTARTLNSLKQMNDYPLYTMTYYGAYNFGDYLRTGAPDLGAVMPPGEMAWSCSVFAALAPGADPLFGRNFDWNNYAALLLFTHPPGGYASVSVVDLGILGYYGPEDRQRLLDAPYFPIDGLNDQGLAVGMMAVPVGQGTSDPDKLTIGSLQIIRLLLDQAAGVEEALTLMASYNISFTGGPPLHYLLADRSGQSVVVEFIQGEMRVLPAGNSFQVATNFIIEDKNIDQQQQSCQRFKTAYNVLDQAGGRLNRQAAMSLLGDISQPNTMWSVVYDLANAEVDISVGRNYAQVHEFKLGD